MSEVKNRIRIIGPDEDYIFHTILNGGRDIDFNNIIPIPSDVYMGDITPEVLEECGDRNWFDWCQRHWSVKANPTACESIPEQKIIMFSTEWNTPFKIWEKISKQFPNTEIRVMYSNDFGDKNEYLIYKNGTSSKIEIRDEFSLASYVWGYTNRDELEKKIRSSGNPISEEKIKELGENLNRFVMEYDSVLY